MLALYTVTATTTILKLVLLVLSYVLLLFAYKLRDSIIPPIVGSWYSKNSSLTKRTTRQDFPTAVSPSSTSLKWHTLPDVILLTLHSGYYEEGVSETPLASVAWLKKGTE